MALRTTRFGPAAPAVAVAMCVGAAAHPALGAAPANAEPRAAAKPSAAAKPTKRWVVLLGLRQRGRPARLATLVADPSSPQYRRF